MTGVDATKTWLELAVEVDHEAVEPVTELFAQYGYNEGVAIEEAFTQDRDGDNLAVDYSKPVQVRTYVAAIDLKPESLEAIRTALWHLGRMRQVGELQISERQEEDWANAWKEHFKPLRAGNRVVIAPPWHEYTALSDDEIVVILDPGMAFGTGTHPSSRLCLMGLEAAIRPGDRVLDVGAGSGILAISAAKLGASAVDAVDIEPVAERAAAENAERNGVADRIRVAAGSAGADGPFPGRYDIVLANIISRVLIELVESIVNSIEPGGTLVLAGIIDSRESLVREAYEAHGLELTHRAQLEDWVGLTYRSPGA